MGEASAAVPGVDAMNGGPSDGPATTLQAGSPLFAELVWAHHRYERARHGTNHQGAECDALERAYLDKLRYFQDCAGKLEHVYWSTKQASAVAMTTRHTGDNDGSASGKDSSWVRWLLRDALMDHDEFVELHRVTDWLTGQAPRVADLLSECDLLAIKVGEILRGTPERIAMRSILGVETHLLGFIERTALPSPSEENKVVKEQRDELATVERYYHRAASKQGRLVYVGGMLIGLIPVFVLAALLGLLLWAAGLWNEGAQLLVLCVGSGAVGALVSAISRMGKPERGKFDVDFELGRPVVRRLGVYRPFLGAVVGVALYFLLASGITQVELDADQEIYYYGFTAFLAGFSERFVNVIFGQAEQRLSGLKPTEHLDDTE